MRDGLEAYFMNLSMASFIFSMASISPSSAASTIQCSRCSFRMTLPQAPYKAERGYRAMLAIGESSQRNGVSELTLDEINAEIDASRAERMAVER